MGSQSELYYMLLSKKSRSLKEKKHTHTHTNNNLHGQFSYKANEKIVAIYLPIAQDFLKLTI